MSSSLSPLLLPRVAAHRTFFSLSQVISYVKDTAGISSNSREKKIDEAHGDMIDAVRELSKGSVGLPMSGSQRGAEFSSSELRQWDKMDLNKLTIVQLSELARSHYDGDFGDSDGDNNGQKKLVIDKNRSVEIWKTIVSMDDNNSEAKYCLASSFRSGEGVTKDGAEAFRLMHELANKHNYYLAHYDLAVMYANNEGVYSSPENDVKAFKHFRIAAKEGIRPALYNIANFLSSGRGVSVQQDDTAAKYYTEAAAAGDPAAMFTLGTWLVQGRGGLTKDVKRAFDLQCKAGQMGHPGAMYNAACHLIAGQGCEVDVPLAAEWFQRAADAGNMPEACFNLGNLYIEGHGGLKKDLVKARNLFARHSIRHEGCRSAMHRVEKIMKDASIQGIH